MRIIRKIWICDDAAILDCDARDDAEPPIRFPDFHTVVCKVPRVEGVVSKSWRSSGLRNVPEVGQKEEQRKLSSLPTLEQSDTHDKT